MPVFVRLTGHTERTCRVSAVRAQRTRRTYHITRTLQFRIARAVHIIAPPFRIVRKLPA